MPEEFRQPPGVPEDQQPTARVVGRRRIRPFGAVPDLPDRVALDSHVRGRTRAPKGVFIYSNHEEMERDRMRWTVDAIVQRQRGD